MSIDHFSISVPHSLFEKEVSFLLAAYGPLGVKEIVRPAPGVVGLGATSPTLWVSGLDENRQPLPDDTEGVKARTVHLALTAKNRKEVDEFHAAAIKAGGKDNGTPGIRKEYHPNYYGAFIIDPCGNNIEAVVHHNSGNDAGAGDGGYKVEEIGAVPAS